MFHIHIVDPACIVLYQIAVTTAALDNELKTRDTVVWITAARLEPKGARALHKKC